MSLVNNWSREAMDEFDFDFTDKASLKPVHSFNIPLEKTDNKKVLVDKISVYLFDLLVNHEKNWRNGQRCRFCFRDTIELDDDEEFVECSTCKRIYPYYKRLERIPFPSQKYLFLSDGSEPYLFQTNTKYKLPFDFMQCSLFQKLK